MVSAESASTRDAGFTIIEVLIALLLVAIMSAGVAELFTLSIRSTASARNQTTTSIAAAQKLEQLRALTWGFDEAGTGLPVSDSSTDLSVQPATNYGKGLNPSPDGTLETSTPGYVDYLDSAGQWVGTGATPPASAVYIRRWSIRPLPTNPNNTLILQVLVTTVKREMQAAAIGGTRKRMADDSLVVTVKTRKAK
jgi:prepilin-type N-terminal cleavage/methylation domain-containing protein